MRIFSILLIILITLTGCVNSTKTTREINVVVLSVMDSLPVHVAISEKLFEKMEIKVNISTVNSSFERSSLLLAKNADITFMGIAEYMILNKNLDFLTPSVRAMNSSKENTIFRLLSTPKSKIKSLNDIRPGSEIAVGLNSVAEYVTETILRKNGIDNYKTNDINHLSIRYEMLISGDVELASLPDPMALLAVSKGANEITNDSYFPDMTQTIWCVRTKYLESNKEVVIAFEDAIEEAKQKINTNKEKYRKVLNDNIFIPDEKKDNYKISTFPTGKTIPDDIWMDYFRWCKQKRLINFTENDFKSHLRSIYD